MTITPAHASRCAELAASLGRPPALDGIGPDALAALRQDVLP
ncbi:MAG: hypothetical protein U0324_07795 [Polyangiales bacterium]